MTANQSPSGDVVTAAKVVTERDIVKPMSFKEWRAQEKAVGNRGRRAEYDDWLKEDRKRCARCLVGPYPAMTGAICYSCDNAIMDMNDAELQTDIERAVARV